MSFSLDSITKTRRTTAPKVVIHGGVKVGKTTFAAQAEKPIFMCTEEGVDAVDADRFPLVTSYDDAMKCLELLYTQDHDFKTLVLDSVDWLEPLVWDAVCKKHNASTIEEVGGGFGKGYIEAEVFWRQFLDGLDAIRNHKGMAIILISHNTVVQISPPDGDSYSKNSLKLNKRATAIIEEWADIIGFATQQTFTKKEDVGFGNKKGKAVKGERMLRLDKNPAYVAGSRYPLPDTLALDYKAFYEALNAATSVSKGE